MERAYRMKTTAATGCARTAAAEITTAGTAGTPVRRTARSEAYARMPAVGERRRYAAGSPNRTARKERRAMIIVVMPPAPFVAHVEATAVIKFEAQRRAETIGASPIRTRAVPLVVMPGAADPELNIPVFIAIIDRSSVPAAAVKHRAVIDRIIPELVGAAILVAIAAR